MTSASVVTKDPDTGILNAGTYRGMIAKKNTIGVLLAMTQGWGKHFSKYKNRGQEMPVAVVIGWDQTLVHGGVDAGQSFGIRIGGISQRRAGGVGQVRDQRSAGSGVCGDRP